MATILLFSVKIQKLFWLVYLFMTPKLSPIAAILCLLFSGAAAAVPLQHILRNALQNDPTVLEARANEQAAQSSVKEARAGHYPIVNVTGTQMITQHHRHDYDRSTDKFNPGINANLNLYAWGGIESEVRQNQHKAEYYHHKITETQEELGSTVGKLYLNALRAKELIAAAQNNIARHERIVADLKIIAKHDKGRQSELDQAMDRKLRAESYLIEQTHQLESNLSRLGKYTGSMMSPNDLEDPFIQDTQANLIERYRNEDLGKLPGYLAQQAEKESVVEEVKVAKAARYPRINLVGTADRDNRELYVNFDWSFYNPAAKYAVERTAHTLTAAETKMDQILRDVAERSRNAQIDMAQYMRRYQLAQQQIASQQRVVKAYELQFKIARRTLIDVLDSYGDLSNIEINAITAHNNYRDAALEYLVSQAAVGKWAELGNTVPSNNSATTQSITDKPEVLTQEKIEKTTTPTQETQNKLNSKEQADKTSVVSQNPTPQPESSSQQDKPIAVTEPKATVSTTKEAITETPKAAVKAEKTVTERKQTVVEKQESSAETNIQQPETTQVALPSIDETVLQPEIAPQQLESSVSEEIPIEPFRQPENDSAAFIQNPVEENTIQPTNELPENIIPVQMDEAQTTELQAVQPLQALENQTQQIAIDPNEDIIATSVFNPTEIALP